MSFIKRLVVDNFQSHEHSEVSFGPGLNVIVGPSDFGKSALVRALRWVFYNEPRGANFISVWAHSCRVTVEMDDGAKITRLRNTTGKNQYLMQRPGEDERVYEGFGNEVPREVVLASQIRKVPVDEHNRVELNFGAQLDGPFLLTENGAVRAKVIGRLGGVHILDWAQKSTTTDLRKRRDEEGELVEGITGVESALGAYAHLNELETGIKQLDEKVARLEAITAEIASLEELLRQWQDSSVALEKAEAILAALNLVERAEQRARELESLAPKYRNLMDITSELDQVGEELKSARDRIGALAMLEETGQRLENLDALSGDYARLVQLSAEVCQTAGQLARVEKIVVLAGDVPEAESALQQAEALHRRWSELDRVAGDLAMVTVDLRDAELAVAHTRAVPDVEVLRQQIEVWYRQWSDLTSASGDLAVVAAALHGVAAVAARTELLEQADSCLLAAGEGAQRYRLWNEVWAEWQETDRNYQKSSLDAEQSRQEMEHYLDDYGKLLTRLGRCPVCFGELTADAVKRALSEYQ